MPVSSNAVSSGSVAVFSTTPCSARSSFTCERHGREHKLELLRSAVGYRKRLARVDGHLVAIREGKAVHSRDTATRAYALAAYKGPAEFLYVRLTDEEYLFLPSGAASSRILVHSEGGGLEAGGSRNSFARAPDGSCRDENRG